jgi:UDP-N-acetylmuramate dehydrogenase
VEIASRIVSVKGLDLETGMLRSLNARECHFGYRDSVFKHELKDKFFITHVTYELERDGQPVLDYGQLQSLSHQDDLTPMDVVHEIVRIREGKLPDRTQLGTAGSFFRNPVVSGDHYIELKEECEELVGWKLSPDVLQPA